MCILSKIEKCWKTIIKIIKRRKSTKKHRVLLIKDLSKKMYSAELFSGGALIIYLVLFSNIYLLYERLNMTLFFLIFFIVAFGTYSLCAFKLMKSGSKYFWIGFKEVFFFSSCIILMLFLKSFVWPIILLTCFLYFVVNQFFNFQINKREAFILFFTLIVIQVSWPIFYPQIDFMPQSEDVIGFVDNERAYKVQEISLSVTPPLINLPFMNLNCQSIFLGHDAKRPEPVNNVSGINVAYNETTGKTTICTINPSDNSRRIIRLKVMSLQPFSYNINDREIKELYTRITKDNQTFYYSTVYIFNGEKVPLRFHDIHFYFPTNSTAWYQSMDIINRTRSTLSLFCISEEEDFPNNRGRCDSESQITSMGVKISFPFLLGDISPNKENIYYLNIYVPSKK